jgi:hypothetical protein
MTLCTYSNSQLVIMQLKHGAHELYLEIGLGITGSKEDSAVYMESSQGLPTNETQPDEKTHPNGPGLRAMPINH